MFKKIICSILAVTLTVFSITPFESNAQAEEAIQAESHESAQINSGQEEYDRRTTSSDDESSNIPPETILRDLPPYSFYANQTASINFSAQTQVDQFSGSAVSSIPIAVPAGRKGIQPSLNLIYSSQNGNGICGMGWMIDLGSIVRSTKHGLPKYEVSEETFILFNNGTSKELVETANLGGSYEYRAETEENFNYFKYANDYWLMKDKAGTKYYFGQTAQARIDDPDNANCTFKWCLEKIEDAFGNYLTVQYQHHENQIYPSEIHYTINDADSELKTSFVEFVYNADRPDKTTSHIARFPIATEWLLDEIRIFTDNEFVRRYKINYLPSGSNISKASFIESVVQYASLDDSLALPAISFEYYEGERGWSEVTSEWDIPQGSNQFQWHEAMSFSLSNFSHDIFFDRGARFADVNNDGLIDMLRYSQGHHSEQVDQYPDTSSRYTFMHNTEEDENINGWNKRGSGDTWFLAGLNFVYSAFNPMVIRDYGYRVGDLNGDGWPDVIKNLMNCGSQDANIYINNKDNGWYEDASGWNIPSDACFSTRHNSGWEYTVFNGVVMADVNKDGLLDLVKAKGSDYRVWLNDGSGWYEDPTWAFPYGGHDLDIADGSSQLIDINGDGILDGVHAGNNGRWTYVNKASDCGNGTYWGEEDAWQLPEGNFEQACNITLADVNQDGLVDLLFANESYQNKVYLNTGAGFELDADWPVPQQVNFRNGMSRMVDVNGDGLLDIMRYEDSDGRPWLWIHNGGYDVNNPESYDYPGLLKSIDNGIGGKTVIQYAPSTVFDNTGDDQISDLGLPMQVVVKVNAQDTVQGQTYETTYEYANGLFDYADKEFRGFGKVITRDAEGTISEIYSHQDAILKGKPKEKIIKDIAGNEIQREVYTWAVEDLGNATQFPYQAQLDTYVYTSSSRDVKHTKAVQEFDFEETGYGKIISQSRKYTYSNAARDDFDLLEITDFVSRADDDCWLIGLPVHSRVEDNAGNQWRQGWNYYDESHTQDPNQITKGLLTKQEGWLASSGSERLSGEGARDDQRPCVYMEYDDYGLLISKSSPRDSSWLNTTTYDQDYHQFPYISSNVLGQSVRSVYDARFGAEIETEDVNGVISKSILDSFGRAIAQVGPYDSIELPGVIYEYDLESSPVRVTKKSRINPGEDEFLTTHTFYDGLGRVIEVKSPAENSSQQILSGCKEYDSRGQVIRQFYPWMVSNTGNSFTPVNTSGVPYVKFEYDAIGRNIKTSYPVAENQWADVLTAYDGWDIGSIDQNGHQRIIRKDAFGRLTQVEEFTGEFSSVDFSATPYAITRYEYNVIGELTDVYDADNNHTHIEYDSLGRKKSMDDPDMGHYEYDYDEAGNLVMQIDNKQQQIDFVYDELNRLTSKSLSVEGRSSEPVNYQYDQYSQRSGDNTEGRLVEVLDSSGSTKFYYDELGREIKSEKNIDSRSFMVERTYDGLDRIKTIKYPDNKVADYSYNLQGQIETVNFNSQPVIANVDYDEFNQIAAVEFANGVTTMNTYDAYTRRLANILTIDANEEVIQNLTYTFDNVGNLTFINDALGIATQEFAYDDLDRLIQAESLAGEPLYALKNYSYDEIGNILQKGGFNYEYNSLRPHAVTAVSNGSSAYSYSYDENGNMVARDVATDPTGSQSLIYDHENRLVRIRRGNNIIAAEYFYDGDGGRVKKRSLHRTGGLMQRGLLPTYDITYYVGSIYEETKYPDNNIKFTDHIFMGSTRVASINKIQLSTSSSYFHPDHLGSTSLITDDSGEVAERAYYAPFGEIVRRDGKSHTSYYFTGKELDEESGLYYYGARYYDSFLGKFITPDSIVQAQEDPQSLNRYSYCRNNPLKYTDPTGHSWWSTLVSAIAGIFGFISSGFNPIVGLTYFSWANTIMSTGEAIAYGANVGRALGSLVAGIAISAAGAYIGLHDISNLGMRMGAFAIEGAAAGAASAAISEGDVGFSAGIGAGAGAAMGFMSSEQFSNWRLEGEFMSNNDFADHQRAIAYSGENPTQAYGKIGIAANDAGSGKGHTSIMLSDGEISIIRGKYPANRTTKQQSWEWPAGRSDKGVIEMDDSFFNENGVRKASWNINKTQYNMAAQYLNRPAGRFALTTNCTDWALGALRHIGIRTPNNIKTMGFTSPAVLYNRLEE